jgi:hypothetical protein
MILYLKDPKNSMRKLLDLISSFGTVARYKNRHEDEWNRRTRDKSTQPQSFEFWQRSPKHILEKKIVSSTNDAGIIGYPHVKD